MPHVNIEEKRNMRYIAGAVFISLCCYIICFRFGAMIFHSNDDASIQDTLSGRYTGTPFPVHQYISVFLSYPIYWLYKLWPNIEWWYILSQSIMLISLLLINYSIGREAEKKHYPFFLFLVLVLIVDFTYFAYVISNTAYTIVSAFAGTASITLLITNNRRRDKIIVCVFLFLISLFYRYHSGLVMLCFLLLCVIYVFFDKHKVDGRRIFACVGLVLFVSGFTVLMNKTDSVIQGYINGQDYEELVSARGRYKDYAHDSYENNPQIYQDVGWSYETYWLANAWCFWDTNVTAESFKYLIQNNRSGQNGDTTVVFQRWNDFKNDDCIKTSTDIWLVITCLTFISIVFGYERKNLVLWFFNTFGTVLLVLYQLYTGRILYRSFIICIMPSVCINCILMIKTYGKKRLHKTLNALNICGFVVCLLFLGNYLQGDYGFAAQKAAAEKLINKEHLQAEYVKEHPDNIYIKHTYTTIDDSPWADRPVNLMDWGKPDYGSAAQRMKLMANGLESLNGNVMKKENVFFLSDIDFSAYEEKQVPVNDRTTHFFYWLKEAFEAKGIQYVDKVCDDIFVYRFIFSQDTERRQTYYDIRDYCVIKVETHESNMLEEDKL